MSSNRIAFLDGHRGVAILAVVFFHAYSRWTNIVPYGDNYSSYFQFGWLGVQLFFLISGFVILMTLEKCSGFRDFVFRRWLRLFPAMLFCSILVYLSSPFFSERPTGIPDFSSLIPGVLFVEPVWINRILGLSISPLEGAFWSLYVEFKFYIVAGLLFFSVGRNWLIFTIFSLSVSAFIIKFVGLHLDSGFFVVANNFCKAMSFQHFGWFAAGSAFYVFYSTRNKLWLFLGFFISFFSSVTLKFGYFYETVWAVVFSMFFIFALLSQTLQNILNNKFFQFFGVISYPLYLIHENSMISMIVKMNRFASVIPDFLFPAFPIAGLCFVSYLVAVYVEPPLRGWLKLKLIRG